MDTTEGRYGEMARKMAEMNDWITPWFDVGVPFWGKPPLSFWMSALGVKLFGVNEFAVRFPQFLASAFIVFICYDWAKRSAINPFYVVAILSTSFLFILLSGAVTTDIALCIGSTLSLRAFWLSLREIEKNRMREQWLFFIGLSIMLYAKGPVGWVLVFVPIVMWAIFTKSVKETWKGLPWIIGCILAIVISLPWYLAAEQHSPGFLHYFFVGEHWQRFTISGWKGDLYGTAHARPRGSIWLYLIVASLPWCLILPITLWMTKRNKNSVENATKDKPIKAYLLLTGLAPCIFFTMSGNTLWTYVLPGLPALALLLALYLGEVKESFAKNALLCGVSLSAIAVVGVLIALTLGHKADLRSAKEVVELYKAQHQSKPIVFLNDKPFSSMFYTAGKAIAVNNVAQMNDIAKKSQIYLAVKKSQLNLISSELSTLTVIGDAGSYRLYLSR
jgi:4-amino-4-deoxy-L-arabinose transferase-like glycosyltransferase